MIIKTELYGELEYKNEDIITLHNGLLGLENLKKYVILELKDYEPFKLMQSIEDSEIGFLLVSPFDFFEEYELHLNKDLLERLSVENENQVMILTTVTLNSNPKKITTNLKAPIVINICNKLGEQIILDKEKYKIKHPLMKER